MNLTKEQTELRLSEVCQMIKPLADERRALEYHLLELQTDIRPGDIIKWQYGQHGFRKGRVLEIRPWVSVPMFIAVRVRQDGTDGAQVPVRPYDHPQKVNF